MIITHIRQVALVIIMTHNQSGGAILQSSLLPSLPPPPLPPFISLCFSRPLSVSLHRPQRVVYMSFLFKAQRQHSLEILGICLHTVLC